MIGKLRIDAEELTLTFWTHLFGTRFERAQTIRFNIALCNLIGTPRVTQLLKCLTHFWVDAKIRNTVQEI